MSFRRRYGGVVRRPIGQLTQQRRRSDVSGGGGGGDSSKKRDGGGGHLRVELSSFCEVFDPKQEKMLEKCKRVKNTCGAEGKSFTNKRE